MEKRTVFIKRYPSKGEFPKEDVFAVLTKNGKMFGFDVTKRTEWWLEEIELPSEEYLQDSLETLEYNENNSPNDEWLAGANFILNHLKSNTNG